MKNIYFDTVAAAALAPAVYSDSANGSTVDLRGYNSAILVVSTGSVVDSGAFSIKLQQSDDGTTFTDVSSDDVVGSLPASLEAFATYRAAYASSTFGRYIRAVITKSGGTSIAASAALILSHAASSQAT